MLQKVKIKLVVGSGILQGKHPTVCDWGFLKAPSVFTEVNK